MNTLSRPLGSLRDALAILRRLVKSGNTEAALAAIDKMDASLARAMGDAP